jgi:alpha-L-rhamnosidase
MSALNVLLTALLVHAATAVSPPTRLRVEYTPGVALGIDVRSPRFSWALLGGRDEYQAAYQLVITQQHGKLIWDSKRVASNQTQYVKPPASVSFPPDSSFDWCVRWWPESASTVSSEPRCSEFSTGIGSGTSMAPWREAQWIVPKAVRGHGTGNQLRKNFTLKAKPIQATLYVACMGYYSASLDGIPASNMTLGDFTNFEKRLFYNTHNVTKQLQSEQGTQHALGFTLSGGWDSRHGSGKNGNSILVLLSIELADGSHMDIVSDPSWKGGLGPMTHADIYEGETFNASRFQKGWDTGAYVEAAHPEAFWTPTAVGGSPHNLTKHPWGFPSQITTHASLPQVEIVGSVAPIDVWHVAGTTNS